MAELYFRSARELGARRYSPAQVAAWAPAPVEAATVAARAGDGRTTVVAVSAAGGLLGYADLEADGHIDHLYCAPEAAGTGVAGALLDAIVGRAQAAGLPRLHVEASELARGLFERRGFTVTARRDFEVRGVAIHNWAMARELDPRGGSGR
jgi:putative acetyltransferase